jgi:hypothetical protein
MSSIVSKTQNMFAALGNVNAEMDSSRPWETIREIVGFEVFATTTMKNVVFCDVSPYTSCKNRRFGGTCPFHLQGGKNSRVKKSFSSLPDRNRSDRCQKRSACAEEPNPHFVEEQE